MGKIILKETIQEEVMMFMFNVKLSKRAILVANYGLFHDGHKKHLEDLLISLSIRFLTQDQDGKTI